MNYKIIKEVMINLKNKIKCDGCQKSFINSDLSITKLEENAIFVSCHCKRCNKDTMVDVNVSIQSNSKEEKGSRDHQGIKAKVNKHSKISQDDVLDFKNFIKDFTGDFKSIFKNR